MRRAATFCLLVCLLIVSVQPAFAKTETLKVVSVLDMPHEGFTGLMKHDGQQIAISFKLTTDSNHKVINLLDEYNIRYRENNVNLIHGTFVVPGSNPAIRRSYGIATYTADFAWNAEFAQERNAAEAMEQQKNAAGTAPSTSPEPSAAPRTEAAATPSNGATITIREVGTQTEIGGNMDPLITVGSTVTWKNLGQKQYTLRIGGHPNASLGAGKSHPIQFTKEGSFNYSLGGADGTVTVTQATTSGSSDGSTRGTNGATSSGSVDTNTSLPRLYNPDPASDNPYHGNTLESPRPSDQVASERRVEDLILRIVNWIVTFLGVVGFGFLIYGGFLYVYSGDKEETTTKAKNVLWQVVIGVILVLAAYALVFTLIGGRGRLFFY